MAFTGDKHENPSRDSGPTTRTFSKGESNLKRFEAAAQITHHALRNVQRLTADRIFRACVTQCAASCPPAHLFQALGDSIDKRAVQLLGVLLHVLSPGTLLRELREQLSKDLR